MSVFQNTIAYATFQQPTATITLVADEFTPFTSTFDPVVQNSNTILKKEIDIVEDGLKIRVKQTGTYYVDFSFIANKGDGKTYNVAPYKNISRLTHYALQFHQQATQQKYEVSMGFIENLTRNDTLSFRIYVDVLPTLDLEIKDVKITIFNLQQLGIH